MTKRGRFAYFVSTALLAAALARGQSPQVAELFEKKVRPVFTANCVACHNAKTKTGGVDLSTPEAISAASLGQRLIDVTSYTAARKMPPSGKLPEDTLAGLREWVAAGSPLPNHTAKTSPVWTTEKRSHWSFQPVRPQSPPAVTNTAWVSTPIDRFILSKLESAGLAAPQRADKLTLLRRAKYDLLGLPPTEAEIDAFLADNSPDAFAKLVDSFLASPHYGEKWGRHWLDVARYADTAGVDENSAYNDAWRYREYVIDAFNRDLPFNRFIREQLAGDLIPPEDASPVNARGLVATGFLGLGPKAIVEIDKRKSFYDVVDEQIDTTSKAFLGLTISCARCHDHKFDPITTRDYYSLAAIFANTQSYEQQILRGSTTFLAPLVDKPIYEKYKSHQLRIAAKNMQAAAVLDNEIWAKSEKRLFPRLPDYMVSAWKVRHKNADPAALAKAENLDEAILKHWVKYLDPSSGFRPHLDEWMKASEADVPAVAQAYGRRFNATAKLWGKILADWKTATIAAVRDQTALPKTPNIEYGDPATREAFNEPSTRFFIDVVIPAKTLNDRTSVDGPFMIQEARQNEFTSQSVQEEIAALKKEAAALTASLPPAPPMANSVGEGPAIEQHVFVRGSLDNPGPIVDRAFPEIVRINANVTSKGSGRGDLANWLTDPAHPLTARVIVNRVWGWHFGDGLVRTPNNFGLTGEAPTHPELLDYLATEFIANGWSIKKLHRAIMLSSAYQSSAAVTPEAWKADPANRLFSRFKRRRIDIEELRDSMLQLSGSLDVRMGGIFDRVDPPAAPRRGRQNGPVVQPFDASKRRSVYLPVNRNGLATPMALNGFVDSTTSAADRPETIIAPQALYLMNNAFVSKQAETFSIQIVPAGSQPDAAAIRRAWRMALTREPEPQDINDALAYIAKHPAPATAWASYCRALLSTNQMHYID